MDLNLISSKLEKLQAPQGQQSQQKFDRSQYFWKAPLGKAQIRFVPYVENKDNPFQEVFFHYGIGNRTMISPINFGDKDPISEFTSQLRDPNNYDKDNWRLAKKLDAKTRYFTTVLVRGEEEKGVRLWQFGKLMCEELMDLSQDEDIGDYTDVLEGRDLTITTVGPETTGTNYNRSNVRVKPKQTAITEDKDALVNYLADQPDPRDIFKRYSFDEIKSALYKFLNPEEAGEEGDIIDEGKTEETPVENNFNLNVGPKVTKEDKFDELFNEDSPKVEATTEDDGLPF